MSEPHAEIVQKAIDDLEKLTSLHTDQALGLANEVAKVVSGALREAEEAQDFAAIEALARQAEKAYLIAAQKVPRSDRDMVAFASTYWSLKADHARLDAQLARQASSKTASGQLAAAKREISRMGIRPAQAAPAGEGPEDADPKPSTVKLREALIRSYRVADAVVKAAAAIEPVWQAYRAAREPSKTTWVENAGKVNPASIRSSKVTGDRRDPQPRAGLPTPKPDIAKR